MAAQRTALKNEVMNLVVTASVHMTAPVVIQNDIFPACTKWKALKNEVMNLAVTASLHIAVLACVDSSLPLAAKHRTLRPMFVLNDRYPPLVWRGVRPPLPCFQTL
jgi:hypothetical protein